jgi:hypothetical protein
MKHPSLSRNVFVAFSFIHACLALLLGFLYLRSLNVLCISRLRNYFASLNAQALCAAATSLTGLSFNMGMQDSLPLVPHCQVTHQIDVDVPSLWDME